ncbi:MAG: hypothetical protein DME20_09690 [Verrucomicrobia bacterium]|nr:MAG: hypothetical protein DME20_09690 [Verrucomicrobiota bacterium]
MGSCGSPLGTSTRVEDCCPSLVVIVTRPFPISQNPALQLHALLSTLVLRELARPILTTLARYWPAIRRPLRQPMAPYFRHLSRRSNVFGC